MQKGYLRIPRALFVSEAWRKATHEQRSVYIDLCFRVAFKEQAVNMYGEEVRIGVGQGIVLQSDMMKEWGMTRQKVRGLLSALIDLNLITTMVATKGFNKYTILTVNALAKECNQGKTPICNQSFKEGNKKNELPPKKDPPGGVFHSEDSVEEVGRVLTLTKQIEKAHGELAEKWRTYLADETDESAKRLMGYLPFNAARICNDPKAMQYIHHSPQIPKVQEEGLAHMDEFFRFQLLDFVYKSGLRTKMHVDALLHLADTLHHRSKTLNVAQVTLFFYLLGNADGRVGKLEWKGWFESDKVTRAFGEYMRFVQNVP